MNALRTMLPIVFATTLLLACSGSGNSNSSCASGPIDADGGVVTLDVPDGGMASVTVPANAVSSTVTLTVCVGGDATGLPAGAAAAGPVITFGPEGQMFAHAVTVSLPASGSANVLFTRPMGGSTWTAVPGAQYTTAGVMLGATMHFSDFVAAAMVQCQSGQTPCLTGCVDLSTDTGNCGACGMHCAGGATCTNGQCSNAMPNDGGTMCFSGTTLCNGTCVDTNTDVNNCGACGMVCNAGASCVLGGCYGPCAAGSQLCGTMCVNLQTDGANCGACSNACTPQQHCSGGVCLENSGCATGFSLCNGACVNTHTDANNCGTCGVICPAGQLCNASACGTNTGCTGTSWTCNGVCVDLNSDTSNCGMCGMACPSGGNCVQGVCETSASCPGGTSFCNGFCVDLSTDMNNCGSCGRPCGAGQTCAGGVCS